jgi:hypothetical protein
MAESTTAISARQCALCCLSSLLCLLSSDPYQCFLRLSAPNKLFTLKFFIWGPL